MVSSRSSKVCVVQVLRKKAARAFEVVAVTFESGFLQAVGDFLFFDDAERGVGARLAAGLQFADAVADFVEHRAFVQTFPRGDEADGGDGVFIRFIGGFVHRFGIDETVFRRAGLIEATIARRSCNSPSTRRPWH